MNIKKRVHAHTFERQVVSAIASIAAENLQYLRWSAVAREPARRIHQMHPSSAQGHCNTVSVVKSFDLELSEVFPDSGRGWPGGMPRRRALDRVACSLCQVMIWDFQVPALFELHRAFIMQSSSAATCDDVAEDPV